MNALRPVLAALLLVAASAAASTFSVSGSGNSFTIKRSGEGTNAAETVLFRTVPLSAFPGRHYTATNGVLAFAPGQIVTNVAVGARSPSADAYKYQNGTTRSYRFELTDAGGFPLANSGRAITTGTSVPSSGAFDIKNVTIQSAEYTADDAGYDKNGYKSVASSAYFGNAAPKDWLKLVGAELRMTLSMNAKENDDAYEYLQLLFDNTGTCDNRSDCKNGDPGNISLSSYMAGFEMDIGDKDATYRNYTFPVTSVGNDEGAANPWGYGTQYPLSKQKFNGTTGSRASDGRIVVPMDFASIVLRLNASGSSGSDEWAASNVVAHVQAVDSAAPTLYNNSTAAIAVSAGPYCNGNAFYISVPFSEIVNASGSTKRLNTTWGAANYESGNGSNVLTFKGTIASAEGTMLRITNSVVTVKDLANNSYAGNSTGLNKTFSGAVVAASHSYTISCDLAGGTLPAGASNPAAYTYDSAAITLANPVRPGYTFDGWSGTGISGLSSSVTIPAHSHGDRAYTAHWTPITYTVHFDANGGAGTMPDLTFTYDDAPQALASNAFTRTGYTFVGWGCDGATFADGATVQNLTNESSTVTLAATWRIHIPYIGADGTERLCTDYTVLANAAGIARYDGGWYVVATNVTVGGNLSFTGTAHLILCDGATLAVTNENGSAIDAAISSLTIYGQTNGTGTVTATGGDIGIYADGDVTINGGTVTATGDGYGIYADDAVTINGGTVIATGGDYYGFYAIYDDISLGWTDPSDSIYASSYGGSVYVKSGQWLTDGIDGIYGYGDYIDRDALAGKTLRPAYRITLPEGVAASGVVTQDGTVAYALPGATVTLSALPDCEIKNVTVNGDAIAPVDGIYSFTASAASITVDAMVGAPWHLLQALLNAGGTVTLVDNVTATNSDSTLTVTNAVTLDLNGHMLDADNRFRVIEIRSGGHLTLTNSVPESGAIARGYASEGGGVYVHAGGAFTMTGGAISLNKGPSGPATLYGTGVYVDGGGTFTMTGGVISNNVAISNGGGVYVDGGGTFTMTGGAISDNTAQMSGGGVYVDSGTFTMDGGAISGNWAQCSTSLTGGGGVYVSSGTFTMNGGAISGNTSGRAASAYGGGVSVRDAGTFTMTGGTISGNITATTGAGTWCEGGGVYVNKGTFTMSGGEISCNTSQKNGGGVSVHSNLSSFEMSGGTISGNIALLYDPQNRNVCGGGGVYVKGCTFTMTGGTISGNTTQRDVNAQDATGGGVYADGTFNVSGNPVVSGNTNSVGAAENVCLPNKKITVDSLTAGATIGVTTSQKPTEDNPVTFTTGAAAGDGRYFFSDNPAYCVDTAADCQVCLFVDMEAIDDIASGVEPTPVTTPVTTTWDFVVAEGWPEIEYTFTGETNVNGRTWTLADCRVRPTDEAGGDTGCLALYSPGSAAVAPAFRGVVTQVTTMFRPASAGSTREVSLLASTDGGATFSVVTNYAIPQRQNYENTFVFDTPLDGGDFGVVFCASNSGASSTVQLRRLTLDGTSTQPDEPGHYDWSPFGAAAAAQPNGALSGVVLFLDPGLGYAADPATNAWTTGAGLANGVVADFGNLDQMNFLARQAWKAGATIVPLRPLGYQTNEVVVDNADAARVTFGGAWANAVTNRHYGRAGDVGYRWTYACPTGATAWASYRPYIPGAGEYPVYAWAPAGPDRVPQLYRVRHAGGVTDVRVDHRRVGDGWVWLGSFRFAEGTAGCVNVSNYAPGCGEGSIVVADAIRFGNGMGDVARGAAGVSGLERELEASRYWIERQALDSQGFPASVYDGAGTDRADADLAPARMAEHMGRMDDGPAWSSILVALDDMAMDATTLKSLRGREALARDMLRDVVHDLAAFRDDAPAAATLPPDAPVAVAATNAGYGRATVSWRMPASKVSDPHTGFVVYASTDGYAFGNPVAVASAADEGSHTFDGLPAGEPYFFRVCAVNAGGESLPSPVAGVGLSFDGSAATVLLVDGFHRADAGLTPVRRYDRVAGADGPVDVPLVRPRMINSFDYVKEHGNAIAAAGRSFDSMDSALVTAADLAGHPFAVWFVGREGVETETLSYDEQRLIATFLDNRGFLFLSGSDIGRDLGSLGTASDRAFLEDRLRCTFVADDGGTGIVGGKTGAFLAGVAVEFTYTNALDDIYAAGRAEVFAPYAVGYVAARYGGAAGTKAAIVAQENYNSGYGYPRTVIAGFPFETIPDKTQRHKLMKTILDFFDDHAISPAWDGHTAYTTGIGGTVEIALKTQVTGWPSPAVTLVGTRDPVGDEVDSSRYTVTVDRFVFSASAVGTYTFTFRAENDAGSINQDVVITVGNAPVWQRVGDILLDLGAATNVNLRSLVSGSPAPAIALDPDRTAADPGTYAFDPATGILALGPSDTPVTNAFVFVASNDTDTAAIALTNIIRRLDTDGDGIPDWWATEHFGGPTGCPNPNLDPDGDLFSNLEEFESLTDPRDRYSQPLPAYLDDAAPAVLTNYVDWACLHGPDRAGTQEAPFLLDIAPADLPACTGALLRVSSFVPTTAGVRLELASDLPGHSLFQPASLEGTCYLCNGILVLETASDLSALTNAPANLRAAPATIEGGAAVIDLPASDAPSFFLRPSIRSVAPAP